MSYRRRCWLCGLVITAGEFSRDHVVPISRGGARGRHNTLASHKACNTAKSNALPSELVDVGTPNWRVVEPAEPYVPPTPTKREVTVLVTWSEAHAHITKFNWNVRRT